MVWCSGDFLSPEIDEEGFLSAVRTQSELACEGTVAHQILMPLAWHYLRAPE